MSHFTVMVAADSEAALDEIMAPFENVKWDEWGLGGRWKGLLRLYPWTSWTEIVKPDLHMDDDAPHASFAPRYQIDFPGMEIARVEVAMRRYDAYQKVLARFGLNPTEPERTQITRELVDIGIYPWGDFTEEFSMDRSAYRDRVSNERAPTFAFIDKLGIWHERAHTGRLGLSTGNNETYDREFAEWVDGIASEMLMFVIDAHI